jgi:hypothetical protein
MALEKYMPLCSSTKLALHCCFALFIMRYTNGVVNGFYAVFLGSPTTVLLEKDSV